jgi:hypothetical protein
LPQRKDSRDAQHKLKLPSIAFDSLTLQRAPAANDLQSGAHGGEGCIDDAMICEEECILATTVIALCDVKAHARAYIARGGACAHAEYRNSNTC